MQVEGTKNGVAFIGKVPTRIKYTFAFGGLGKDLIYGMIATFSMIYFTDILKVTPAFIGMMFFVAKIWDAFNDLIMGMIVDNTHSRWGKFIPWLVIGTLVNAVVFVLLFTDFHLNGYALCVFATVVYIGWGMTYTLMDIPYWSIIPNLTADPEEREKISVLPRMFASMGQSLVIAGFGVEIMDLLGGGQQGYHRFSIIIAILFIFTIGISVVNLPVVKGSATKKNKVSFKDIFKIIRRNDQLKSAVLLILLYNVGYQCVMGVAAYYFRYVCGNMAMLSAFMISASVAEIVGLLTFPKLARKLSRKTSFFFACTLPFVGLMLLLIVGFVSPQNIIFTAIAGVIVKYGSGLELGCATVFLSDVVDYGEYKMGTRNEGVIFSLQTLIVKFTSALTALGLGAVLSLTGYNPGGAQTLATMNWIRLFMCVIPAIFMLLSYLVYKKLYKLNDEFMKTVVETITNRPSADRIED